MGTTSRVTRTNKEAPSTHLIHSIAAVKKLDLIQSSPGLTSTGFITSRCSGSHQSNHSNNRLTNQLAANVDERSNAAVRNRLNRSTYDLVPPAISTTPGRGGTKRLSEAADVAVDGDPLKPHAGRRTLGDELYEQYSMTSQETLRHQSIETTHASYSDKQGVSILATSSASSRRGTPAC